MARSFHPDGATLTIRPHLGLLLLVMTLVATGCQSSPCDPGQTHSDGLCYPDVDAAPVDGSPVDGGADAAVDAFAHYGDVCAETGECEAPTDYCAVQPGSSAGYCTHTGCVEDEAVCPPEWGCLDLSVFDPTLPSICTPP